METDDLKELLLRLHDELEGGPPVDASTRELLVSVLDDIRGVLEPPAAAPEAPPPIEHHSLADRLKDATRHLEETHPRLASAVEEMANALAAIFR
jgi:hypothetical protein